MSGTPSWGREPENKINKFSIKLPSKYTYSTEKFMSDDDIKVWAIKSKNKSNKVEKLHNVCLKCRNQIFLKKYSPAEKKKIFFQNFLE